MERRDSLEKPSMAHEQLPQVEDFAFSSVQWDEVSHEGGLEKFRYSLPVQIGDRECTFVATRVEGHEASRYAFHLALEGKSALRVTMRIDRPRHKPLDVLHTYVERSDVRYQDAPVLPPGSAMIMYEKMLDFIPRVVRDRPLRHIEKAEPVDGNLDKWKAKFGPILSERGYNNDRAQDWVRDYQPNTTNQ